ncbi:MAG TPA: amidase [Candidatus Binataceae bacterium]|nr:amidase [Candidatus Binataceae bacterium]
MASNDLLDFDVAALAEHLRAKKISPLELTQAYLDRIARVDEKINAYITVTADDALASAKQAESEIVSGNWRGTFHGVPVGLKDLLYTKGVRTTGGSKILAEFRPDFDATSWARLKAQGAVMLGKLNLHEFAYGVTSSNPHWGACRNPYALDRIPGGSSGGSAAAIVARTAAATIGTDTGGSIRIPASLCGCVGLKPTWSRVSRYGVIPLAYTMDHVGPITRTVRDAALMLNVIAGHDPNDSTSSREPVPDYTLNLNAGVKGTRVGVVRELMGGLSDDVAKSFKAAMQQLTDLGATVEEVSIPSLPTANVINSIATFTEALEYHEEWFRTRADDYGADVRRLLEAGIAITGVAYVRAQRARAQVLADALAAMEKHDVLAAPGSAITAPKIGESGIIGEGEQRVDVVDKILRFTAPFDCTGQPALAIPTGLGSDGLPLSMQIIGRPFDETSVLRVASTYEAARGAIKPPAI